MNTLKIPLEESVQLTDRFKIKKPQGTLNSSNQATIIKRMESVSPGGSRLQDSIETIKQQLP